MNDPIVDEVRRVRDAHAAMFNYDLDAIFQDIKEQEKKSGLKSVSYPPRRTEPNLKGFIRQATRRATAVKPRKAGLTDKTGWTEPRSPLWELDADRVT